MLLSHILCTILVILFSIINVSLGKTASVFQIIPGTDDQLQFLYNINSHLNGVSKRYLQYSTVRSGALIYSDYEVIVFLHIFSKSLFFIMDLFI